MEKVEIGNATLYRADCLDVLPTLGKVDAVVTDPPYEREAHSEMRRTQKSIKSGIPDSLDFNAITEDMRRAISKWCFQSCNQWFLAFCQVEACAAWQDAAESENLKYKRSMAWIKPDSSPQFNGRGPAQGYECIASSWCGIGHSFWNGGGKRGVFTHMTNQSDRHGEHQTEKPISLMLELVKLFTQSNALVLDPFMGSGTTGVACAKLGRKFIGVEIEPKYFDIACERIQKAYDQPDLFIEPPKKAEQIGLL